LTSLRRRSDDEFYFKVKDQLFTNEMELLKLNRELEERKLKLKKKSES
jgi:hypothetical protein